MNEMRLLSSSCVYIYQLGKHVVKKSRIRKTLNLSTDADSSTIAGVFFSPDIYFCKIGPLGPVGLLVAMCVCLFLCFFVCFFVSLCDVPFSCNFFAWSDWCRACLVHGLV